MHVLKVSVAPEPVNVMACIVAELVDWTAMSVNCEVRTFRGWDPTRKYPKIEMELIVAMLSTRDIAPAVAMPKSCETMKFSKVIIDVAVK